MFVELATSRQHSARGKRHLTPVKGPKVSQTPTIRVPHTRRVHTDLHVLDIFKAYQYLSSSHIIVDMDRLDASIEQRFHDLFVVRAEYKIIQCIQCQDAINPSRIEGHLRYKHAETVEAPDRRNIARYVKEHVQHVAQDKTEVIYPAPDSPPVTGFPLYHNGLRCVLGNESNGECGYICRSIKGM